MRGLTLDRQKTSISGKPGNKFINKYSTAE